MKKIYTFEEVYNILFQERLKATCITGYELIGCKETPCSWKEIYEPRLKRMKVSQKTLASILKIWQKTGLVKKVKAPFPYRSKYKLARDAPEFEYLKSKVEIIENWAIKQSELVLKRYPEVASQVGKEAVSQWEQVSKEIFLTLLESGLTGTQSKMSAAGIAFYCFVLVDYLLHTVANLHGKSREEAKKILSEYINQTEERKILENVIVKGEMSLEDALTRRL